MAMDLFNGLLGMGAQQQMANQSMNDHYSQLMRLANQQCHTVNLTTSSTSSMPIAVSPSVSSEYSKENKKSKKLLLLSR